ncbi:MAG: hypothetical protein ACOY4F_14445 [Thermodesulfobacteriota bacterium]
MEIVSTRYGAFRVQGMVERHPDGSPRAVTPVAETLIETRHGVFSPRHTAVDERKKTGASLEFHPDGSLRSIILEDRAVVSTPAGPVVAEQIVLHPDGGVKRVFPLCGKTSAYWSEEDEARLLDPFPARTPLGTITARYLSLGFDPAGRLRSLTLWPGESVELETPVGRMAVRIGAAFYPDGALRSVEPARPTRVPTPVGDILAYDPDAVGVTGDVNSLGFDSDGRLVRVAAVRTALMVGGDGQAFREIVPDFRESLCGDGDREPVALLLVFGEGGVTIRCGPGSMSECFPLPVPGGKAGMDVRARIMPLSGLLPSMDRAACHGAPGAF